MPGVTLTFVGSGDAFSSMGRLQSGVLIESSEAGVLLDCGATLLAGLENIGKTTDQIDVVAISHLHGDHFAGLPFLLLDALYLRQRTKPLTILGPSGTRARVEALNQLLYPGALDTDLPFDLCFEELKPGQPHETEGYVLTALPVRHGQQLATSLHLCINAVQIAYSGDTEWCEELIRLAQGTDLLICECCSYDQQIPGHLDYRTIHQNLPLLETGRVILTHTGPSIDENLGLIELQVASDGTQLTL